MIGNTTSRRATLGAVIRSIPLLRSVFKRLPMATHEISVYGFSAICVSVTLDKSLFVSYDGNESVFRNAGVTTVRMPGLSFAAKVNDSGMLVMHWFAIWKPKPGSNPLNPPLIPLSKWPAGTYYEANRASQDSKSICI